MSERGEYNGFYNMYENGVQLLGRSVTCEQQDDICLFDLLTPR